MKMRTKQSNNAPTDFQMNSTSQLLDSLTSHLSLYHSSSSIPTPSSHPRSSIIKWFSSLSVHQRRAHLTAVDFKFTQTFLQMLRKLKSNGHGFFLVLPDIPSDHRSSLPSLCFRRSQGLLSRVAKSNESERLIRESTLLFSSKEGEFGTEFGRVGHDNCLDSITVNEELVANVERFVGVMDGISSGQFLRGEEITGLGAEWVEMEWLKTKGYYSMEAFVVNRLEVALRIAWLNCNNSGKKRGVKLKEKVNGAGIAATVFWRKKGCVDWWCKLEEEMKKKVFQTVVGKAAKCLAAETVEGKNFFKIWQCHSTAELSLRCTNAFICQENSTGLQQQDATVSVSGNSCSLNYFFRSLTVLQEISSVLLAYQHLKYDDQKLFFSSPCALNTPTDFILRKVREILMVVSLDCTKFELLEEGIANPATKKRKEKLAASNHKKKGKKRNVKKSNPATTSFEDDNKLVKVSKDNGNGVSCSKNADLTRLSSLADDVQEKDLPSEPFHSSVHVGHNGLNDGNVRSASRKSRKERNNFKNSNCWSIEMGTCEPGNAKMVSFSSNSQNETLKSNCTAEDSSVLYGSDNLTAGIGKHEQILTDGSSTNDGKNLPCLKGCLTLGTEVVVTDKAAPSVDSTNCDMHSSVTSAITSVSCIDGIESTNPAHGLAVDTKSGILGEQSKGDQSEGKVVPVQQQGLIGLYDVGTVNSSVYISYEWPSIAPVQLPAGNSYLPAATDRLHLDVGHNWQNHFQQSFVPAVHRVRNSPVDSGCTGIISRPLPMSLDWPPVVGGLNSVAPSVVCNYDSGFISRRQSCFRQNFSARSVPCSVASEDDRGYSSEFMDSSDVANPKEMADEPENHWMSEEELELHAVSGVDYNQYFGGGVMYWNPSDYHGSNFSRPPSLSSDDSSWACREADMNRAVDDMVSFSSSYSTNGLTSPSAASFCSPFDPLGPGHQAVGFVLSEGELSGKVLHTSSATDVVTDENGSGAIPSLSGDSEMKAGDSFAYPILRPIIIPSMTRERSRSDFKHSHDRKSPCVPPNSREQPRIKRPPSPVVLCVPRAPRPPPPSPVGDSRKHRGFPTVRSGSSSPRHWGVKGWSHDGINFEEGCLRMDGSEVVWPSWRNKSYSAHQLTQPVPGALLQDRLIAISQLARDQEHPDVAFPLQPPELLNCPLRKASLPVIQSLLHNEIDSFCKQVGDENLVRKPYINWAVKRVTRSLQVLWPRSRTNIFGSNATGLSLPSSDVDLVVCLPPVRNLEPIKEAGILEGRNGIKETCLQHAARYLANQEWVKNDSLKIVENTAIPIIMLVVEVPHDFIAPTGSNVHTSKEEAVLNTGEQCNSFQADPTGSEQFASQECYKFNNKPAKDVKSVRLDISFKSPSHTGLQTTELVKELTEQFPAATPLALVLKKFLADRGLDQSYSGGLSSYCLVLLIIRFLQHEHHLGRPINQNYGCLLMDFLYFFGNVFDPRQMRVSVQGSGMYINREQGYSIDPIYIDDPLFPTNNVGRNCFRIHQCIKAFADAYSTLENELTSFPSNDENNTRPTCKLLLKIVPSIGDSVGS